MPSVNNHKHTALAVGVATLLSALPAAGYELDKPWSFTANDGTRPTDSFGNPLQGPVRLTWHVVEDGVLVDDSLSNSTLPNQGKSFLESTFGTNPAATNPLLQPWYDVLNRSYQRIESLSGIDFNYQFFDDGATVNFANQGIFTARADMRITGLPLGSDIGTLAYNFAPDGGDMVINTDKAAYIGDPADNYLNARNLFTHEIMHGVGVRHNDFNTQALMYPSPVGSFDGPQFDDIAALHQLYNDARDRSDASLSNPEHVIPVNGATTFFLGMDAGDTQLVTPDQTDFVSVTNQDKDYFQFTLDEEGGVAFAFNPVGPSSIGEFGQVNSAKHIGRLGLELYDETGFLRHEDTADALGESIGFFGLLGPGTYSIELSSNSPSLFKTTQMYNFVFTYVPEPSSLALLSFGGLLITRRRRAAQHDA